MLLRSGGSELVCNLDIGVCSSLQAELYAGLQVTPGALHTLVRLAVGLAPLGRT